MNRRLPLVVAALVQPCEQRLLSPFITVHHRFQKLWLTSDKW